MVGLFARLFAFRRAPLPRVDAMATPALVIDKTGDILCGNDSVKRVAAALGDGRLAAACRRLVAAARRQRGIAEEVSFADGSAAVNCELVGVPLGHGRLLVAARYGAFDRNLREALVDSRRRFKDLVEVSSDFAWETGPEGTFVYVSPQGALGWSADQLVGQPPEIYLSSDQRGSGPNLFQARRALQQAEIWFRRADGGMALLSASVRPLFDDSGRWIGARGVCRDVSEARARDAELVRAHTRERLFGYIARAMREEIEPSKMLAAAAEAVARALSARGVEIHRIGLDGPSRAALAGEASSLPGSGAIAACLGRENVVAVNGEGVQQIAVATRYRGAANGAMLAWRDGALGPFDEDERRLAADTAAHLALALQQVAAHEQLMELSSTDSLTGLLNRRSFMAALERRFERASAGHGGGALVYCDLDNFKQVNDTHGHERGDEALRALARILKSSTRGEDLVARLGGDEFALWLEGTDEAASRARAAHLLDRARELVSYSGGPEHPLGISLGVAVAIPGAGESLDQIMARADIAMYASKKQGKGRCTVADAPAASRQRAGGAS